MIEGTGLHSATAVKLLSATRVGVCEPRLIIDGGDEVKSMTVVREFRRAAKSRVVARTGTTGGSELASRGGLDLCTV